MRDLRSALVRASFSHPSRRRIGWILGAAGGLAMAGLLALAFTLASEPGAPAFHDMPRGTSASPQAPSTGIPPTTKEGQPVAGAPSTIATPTEAVVPTGSGPPPLTVQGPERAEDRSPPSSSKAPAPLLGDD